MIIHAQNALTYEQINFTQFILLNHWMHAKFVIWLKFNAGDIEFRVNFSLKIQLNNKKNSFERRN
jgi:hypothetical protein